MAEERRKAATAVAEPLQTEIADLKAKLVTSEKAYADQETQYYQD